MSLIVDGTTGVTFNDSSLQGAAASPFGLKNRIINGDMVIDQRNAGAAVSGTPTYPVDRFRQSNNGGGVLQGQQVSDAPAGFSRSVRFTVTTIDSSIAAGEYYQAEQFIEGFNVADLGWGTANAQTVTLSFWVKASQTGTYSVALSNDAGDRSYPSFYTILVANTWEFKTITIPGSTSGTWLVTNGTGIGLRFGFVYGSTFNGATANAWMNTSGFANAFITSTNNMMSTLNATWQLTGVQLERNTTATPFEWIPYTTELQLCQRYCFVNKADQAYSGFVNGALNNGNEFQGILQYPVQMRTSPSLTSSGNFEALASGVTRSATLSTGGSEISSTTVTIKGSLSSSGTQGNAALLRAANDSTARIILSAEL